MPPEPTGSPQQISAAVQEVAERAQLLVREEIELAKAEITLKLTKLAKGAAIGAAAAVFVIGALILLLHGFSWLAWWLLPVSDTQFFWGFFLVAFLLFVFGAIAGFAASKLFKSGAPPTPDLAIEEAQKIKDTVST
ncbi:MAG TPA: phage holin family protein [Capillimicrobium sp.]|nr:phage holin family protein [Capillimicrobium sp.]